MKETPSGFPFHNSDLIAFQQPTDNWIEVSRPKGVHWSPSTFPETLAEFQQWWTELGELPYEVDFPREFGAKNGSIGP